MNEEIKERARNVLLVEVVLTDNDYDEDGLQIEGRIICDFLPTWIHVS